MRIYLDMCSVQRPLDERTQLRIHLEAESILGILAVCESGGAELLSSGALLFETSRNPHPVRRGYAEEVLMKATAFAPTTEAVERRARTYAGQGIKPLDALHLASAVEAGADYFCTCDDRLLKRAREIDTAQTRPLSPLELIQELES